MSNRDYLRELEDKYEEIIKRDPMSNSFVLLAEVLLKQKKHDRAIKILVNGLLHNKHNITARFLLGKIYYERWMIDQAKREFEKIIKIAPDNLAVAKILVEIYKSEKNYDRALEIINKLSFYFADSEDISNIALELEQLRNNNMILDTANSKQVDNSNDGIKKVESDLISETLGDLYFKQGHFAKSIEIYNKLLEADPGKIKIIEKIKHAEKMNLNENTA